MQTSFTFLMYWVSAWEHIRTSTMKCFVQWMKFIYMWRIKTSHKTLHVHSTNFFCPYMYYSLMLPWYSHTGWLGLKHQVTYCALMFRTKCIKERRTRRKMKPETLIVEELHFGLKDLSTFHIFFSVHGFWIKEYLKKKRRNILNPPPQPQRYSGFRWFN